MPKKFIKKKSKEDHVNQNIIDMESHNKKAYIKFQSTENQRNFKKSLKFPWHFNV